jgi:carboxypeptidase C (cathepsin A)
MRCIIVVGLLLACHGAPDADQVLNLPGWSGDLPTKHFSGFVERDTGTRTHYWLVESEGNPETDPLIIWFNGGPPCSALVGSFSEMGPFRINFGKEDTEDALKVNPGRWNQRASLLFYENPPGVGFTYNKNESGYDADDNSQASDNLDALLGFYGKFPEYLSRKLFIAGESYAGVYIPMLAQKIVEHNTESSNGMVVPLEGILVGNGATATGDWYEGYLTNLRINHLYAHGLFGEPLYASIQTECKNFTKGIITDKCAALVKLTTNETGVLNQYDVSRTRHHITSISLTSSQTCFVWLALITLLLLHHRAAPLANMCVWVCFHV